MSEIRVTYTGLISFIGGIIALVTSSIFSLTLTRMLSPEEYGQWGLILSVIGYFVVIHPIFSYWTTREIARGIDSAKTAIVSTILFSFFISAIFIITSNIISVETETDYTNFLFATTLIPLMFLAGILTAITLGHKPHAISFATISFSVSQVLFGILFLYVFKFEIIGAIITLVIAYSVNCIVLFFYSKEKIKQSFDIMFLKNWFKLSWISLYPTIYNILGELTVVIFILISGSILGIAFWTASAVLASVISTSGLISRGMYPKLLENKGTIFLRDNIVHISYFGIIFTISVITFAKPGLFVLNPLYESAYPVVLLLAIEGFIVVLINSFQSALIGIENVDRYTSSTFRDYAKSNLFFVNTLRLIQTIFYVSIFAIGLVLLVPILENEIELLVFWASILLITQIPLFIYLSILIKRNFESAFDLKKISKFVLIGVILFLLYQLILPNYLIYDENLFKFIPNLFLLMVSQILFYVVITYFSDQTIRQLFKSILNEMIKKNK